MAKSDDAEKDEKKDTKKAEDKKDEGGKAAHKADSEKTKKSRSGAGLAIVCAIVALAVGLGIGYFVFGGGTGGAGSSSVVEGVTTVSEDDLDSAMATYTYNGTTTEVTVREVIESMSSLDASLNDDGTYTVPSADGVLSYVRSAIVEQAADDAGIEISDEELDAYAESILGSSDYDSIASSYGMEADAVKELILQSAKMEQLREQVVTTESMEAPYAPTEPEDGDEQTASEEYAQYIIDLAGDEWDSEANGWAAEDGPYATALADYTVTNDSATYEAATAAYYVAYQLYSENQTEISTEWTEYVNSLLCNATITISTLEA